MPTAECSHVGHWAVAHSAWALVLGMNRFGISTHLFHEHRLCREHLVHIAAHGFDAIELFATRSHFDYHDERAIAELAEWLADTRLEAPLGARTDRPGAQGRQVDRPVLERLTATRPVARPRCRKPRRRSRSPDIFPIAIWSCTSARRPPSASRPTTTSRSSPDGASRRSSRRRAARTFASRSK